MIDLERLKKEQNDLAKRAKIEDRFEFDQIRFVAGIDQSFESFRDRKTRIVSAAVLMSFPALEILEKEVCMGEVDFPYIPGFLMFREGENAVKVLKKIIRPRTVLLVDGSGIAHPRKCGLATYLAIETETPAIGVTKHRLVGDYEEPRRVGEARPLFLEGEKVGYVLKSCTKCRPIFLSPGSFITPDLSLRVVKSCLRGFKLPEPIRIADKLAKESKKELG
jgi:deoxyribonuclease V